MTDIFTSQDLLEKVRTGKGDPEIYTESLNIYVKNIFGGYLSRTRQLMIYQDPYTGENDIRQAKAAMYTYQVDMSRNNYPEELYLIWESKLEMAAMEFNEGSTYIKVELKTRYGIVSAKNGDMEADNKLIPIAMAIVGFYIICVLGSCSPIHCRVLVGIGAVFTISLAIFAGFSVMFAFGG